jgi:hypothetical protein
MALAIATNTCSTVEERRFQRRVKRPKTNRLQPLWTFSAPGIRHPKNLGSYAQPLTLDLHMPIYDVGTLNAESDDMERNVRQTPWLFLFFFSMACCPLIHASSCPARQPKTPDALAQIEHAWASALEQRDTAALGCILGDEFQATLSKAANHRPVHHELQDLSTHVYGDFGYIRGLATAVDAQGKIVARVRFTDIYVYRDRRWQAVAAHESMLPATN